MNSLILHNNERTERLDFLPALTNQHQTRRCFMANQQLSPDSTEIKKICNAKGCNRPQYETVYCSKHYMQMRRYGKILKRTKFDPNEIICEGDICRIILYDNKTDVVIDREDKERIEKYRWRLVNGYAYNDKVGKLHNFVLNHQWTKNSEVDHKNRDPLNCRKNNLRRGTKSNNLANRPKQKNNKSGFKGISWDKRREKWEASINHMRKKYFLGYFNDPKEAAMAYNAAAKKHFGEFAWLNDV